MKFNLFLGLAVLCSFFSIAQTQIPTNSSFISNAGFAISKPLIDMPVVNEELDEQEKQIINPRRKSNAVNYNKTPQPDTDPIIQSEAGNKLASPPIVNWQGTSGNASPPDPSGAAGPAHYVQAVNIRYQVYNKTGTSLGGPYALNSLWAGSTNMGDPIVMYDRYADRWFVSQFNGSDKILVAISTSSNPLGSYYTYTFVPSPGNFPDYPKFSIWADGYYCTSNIGGTEKFAVFDRTKMLAGNPTAGMISLTVPPTPNYYFFSPLPADADGQLPPYGTPCPIFCYEDNAWPSATTDQIRIFKFTANWTTPTASSLTLDQTIPTSSINAVFDVNYDDITQPGTSQKIDAIGGVFMYRAQYRRWTGYNTILLNHAVIVNSTTKQTGIRWYELRQNTTTGVWSIYQEGTYAPDLHSRWMGSMAMDDNGSIGIAYAVSSGTVYPSIRYTGRLATDPLGQFTFAETAAATGTTSQTSHNRFGDYSQTSLDPDGITFWHTGEYLASGGKTRIFSWQIPLSATGINDVENKPDLLVFQTENKLNIKGKRLPKNMEVQLDVFDLMGKQLSSIKLNSNDGTLEYLMDVSGFAKSTYLVRLGNEKFQKVVKTSIH